MDIFIDRAPENYQPYLKLANDKGNQNRKVDTYDEAFLAADQLCYAQPEDCEGFVGYLAENDFHLGLKNSGTAPWMLKVEKIGVNDIIQKIIRSKKPDFQGNNQEAWEYFLEHQQELPEINAALKSKGFINFMEDPGGEIGQWAREVTQNETTDDGKLRAYIDAFKQRVKYDMNPLRRKGRILTAYEVFKNGYGDCNEMSNLFWVGAQAIRFNDKIEIGFLVKMFTFFDLKFTDGLEVLDLNHALNSIRWGKDFALDLTDAEPKMVEHDPSIGKPLSLQENMYLSYWDSMNFVKDPAERKRMLALLKEILPDIPEQIKFEETYSLLIVLTSRYINGAEIEGISPDGILIGIREALEQRPGDFVLYYLQGLIYEKRGKAGKDKETLSKAADAFERAVRENPYLIMAYVHLCNVYKELGMAEQAWGAIYRLEQKYPDDVRINMLLGEALSDRLEAEKYLKKAAELWDQPQAHLRLGVFYLNQNEVEKAKKEIAKAGEGIKALFRAYLLDEILLSHHELKFDETEKKLRALQETFPEDYAPLSLELGAFKDMAEGNIDEATQKMQKRIGMAPENDNNFRVLGWCQLILGRYDEAKTILKKGSELKGADKSIFYKYFSLLRLLIKDYKGIGEDNQGYARSLMAARYGLDVQKAEEMGQEAMRRNYDSQQAAFILGCISLQKGETEKAKSLYEKSLKQFPQDNPVLSPLALIYLSEGELQKARRLLETHQSKDFLTYVLRAELLLVERKYQQAENYLIETIASGARDQFIYLLLWTTYLFQGKAEEAKEAFRKMIQESL
jgi:tetratricopeptide (TPR) repeat protein